MIAIPAGTLLIGSAEFYADEGPVHERDVAEFELDEHPVTNGDYAAFVAATGYVTVAERELDPADFVGADPDDLVPGSMVFTPTDGPVDLDDWRRWWRWQPGARWSEPEGPGSSIDERMRHPVVHVSFEDAATYAAWAGKRLPTETEWEWAARGGLIGARFAWGNEENPRDAVMVNRWHGSFPYRNTGSDGWVGTSPVGTFAPNGYGLFDMTGNTWEWTTDFYTPRHVVPGVPRVDAGARANLLGPTAAPDARRVLKGGSHLCSPDYCLRYRPAARSPQSEDTAMTHLGFRCAR
ncbi:formylglycine-generating enzyme family protein [Microbacterium sp.]|jgi:formylglycine-generating enzyme required for sulfatase activity|uniref:formylglycine-generating enzyme family protein n=1 Tax=Microbacterium sp. TaxID=51671 RepID=UPI0025E6AD1B|nr:formylglycine-generating enzyme family protein [Microbacterium sp.]